MLNFQYDPDLTIRGLHYDITNGLLIKVNAVLQIQSDAVFRGKYINAEMVHRHIFFTYILEKINKNYDRK